jgi:hypothetical protein
MKMFGELRCWALTDEQMRRCATRGSPRRQNYRASGRGEAGGFLAGRPEDIIGS